MSDNYNTMFRAYTQGFINHNFMTALRIGQLQSGHAPFDLSHHLVNGNHVVTLENWAVGRTETPLLGYWVPQGGSCVIPVRPGAAGYVFTPDFSGCSIMVDQISADQYRVYHVQGGSNYCEMEYTNSAHDHGLGLAASMKFDTYGESAQPRGFAFMKHEEGQWWIYYQGQNGVGLSYSNGQFIPVGAQTVRSSGRIPVAILGAEVAA